MDQEDTQGPDELGSTVADDAPERRASASNPAVDGPDRDDSEHLPGGDGLTGGQLVEAAVANAGEGEVGPFVDRGEPPEYAYDRELAVDRSVDVLRQVLQDEGIEIHPDAEIAGRSLAPDPASSRHQSHDALTLRSLISRVPVLRDIAGPSERPPDDPVGD